MKTFSRRLFVLLIVVLLVGGQPSIAASLASAKAEPSPAAHSDGAASGQAVQPLDSLLQSDGTLNLNMGFSGSLDPRGWRMISLPGEPPRFVRASDPVKTVAHARPDAPTVAGDESWDDRFDVLGVSGYVRAIAVSGSDVYVGGIFSAVGNVTVNNVAKWNSTTGTWSALGSGVSGYVYAIAVGSDGVYVGGLFNEAGGVEADNVARWNPTTSTWSALSTGLSNGVSSWVYAIAISGNDVYVGGLFNGIGGVSSVNAYNIARWNSATHTWSGLGPQGAGGVAGYVYAIAVSGNDVYVGGLFNGVPTYPSVLGTSNIAKWNSTTGLWSALGEGVSGYVYAIAVSGSDVYVGGLFNAASDVPNTFNIAKWNGSSWSAMGKGVAGYVYAIAVSGNDVYVGGLFNAASDVPNTFNIAKWNGSSWSALGSGVSGCVYAIALGADGVYVGGLFNAAGGKASRNFGRWYGNIANPPTSCPYWDDRFGGDKMGLYGRAEAIAVSGSDVYVGGYFSKAGGVSAANIARWDGSQWWALGSGVNLRGVYAIAVSGSDVYVGGNFTMAGGVSVNNVAKWDGSQWSALGSGLGGNGVYALAVVGNDLYAGGNFGSVGGPVLNFAKWDGSRWTSPGGIDGYGLLDGALTVSGSDLYLGGSFSRTGTTNARNIARWDGSRFWALGSGVNDSVTAIAVSGSDVYAGGVFTTAGGVSANYVARWDGSRFWALGSGVNNAALAIAVSGNDVYVGGWFTMAGGVSANRIARWDGSRWSPLCSGIGSSNVTAIAVSGSDVYVGGNFATAGGKPSYSFAIYHAAQTTPSGGTISGRVTGPGGVPITGAPVQICRPLGGPCFWIGTTGPEDAIFTSATLWPGPYRAAIYPPANFPWPLRPNATGTMILPENTSLSGQDIELREYQPIPTGVSLVPSQLGALAVPRVRWSQPLSLAAQGCLGGSASYQITQGGAVLRGGALAENPAGKYSAGISPLAPHAGDAEARITIQCPAGLAPQAETVNDFDLYIEPDFTVRALGGRPLAGASVTLYAYDAATGSFQVVPSGDARMGPINRVNPDTTDSAGQFGWDLSAGIYQIRAAKAGCALPGYPPQAYVESDVLVIPEYGARDINLYLDCGVNNAFVYLPIVRR